MQRVRKRHVFYVSGFDPRGAAAYHRIFCDEAEKHAARSGASLVVSGRRRVNPLSSTWRVERDTGGDVVETTFEFLHWDDIVRRHWRADFVQLYPIALKTYWHWLVSSDLLARVFRMSKLNFLAGIAPALLLFVLPPLAPLAAWGGYALARFVLPEAGWLAWSAGVSGLAAVAILAWWLERFFTLGWLLRTYGFVLDYSLGRVPELAERMERFAGRIAEYITRSDDDEILIVGHSVGANVAVSVLARALAMAPDLFRRHRAVCLLTLGGSIPMQGLLPWSGRFREELARLAATHDLAWVDVSAPQDVASFALLNPVRASGIVLEGAAAQRPLVVSGAFKEMIHPEDYEAASWNLFRMHFQYLMAGDVEHANDYVAITTGPTAFRERFGDASRG